jgi:hypothetical protein
MLRNGWIGRRFESSMPNGAEMQSGRTVKFRRFQVYDIQPF